MAGRQVFKIHGLDCPDEVAILRREIGPLAGGADRLTFDILNARMTVLADPGTLPTARIQEAVAQTGMRADPVAQETAESERATRASWWTRWHRTLLTAGSGVLVAVGMLLGWWVPEGGQAGGVGAALHWMEKGCFVLAMVAGLYLVLPKAWLALKYLRPDMNLLMVVAVIGAVGIGDWAEAASVAFLFALSLELEAWSVGRARQAIEALLDLTPPVARVLEPDGGETQVPVGDVQPGRLLLVKPGERIPLDGTVNRGAGHVNQAPITGESVPVFKEAGAELFAGSINGEAALTMQVTKAPNDTVLARIIRMIGETQGRRANFERWVDRFAAVYTPTVMVLAVLVAVGPPLFTGEWATWLYRALVLLVIACPCALVISTPVSIVAALASAARNGVLVKGGLFLEMPARLRAIALDKTGTLTLGKPQVVRVIPLNGHSVTELLQRAAGLESRSEHPLARAVVEHARALRIEVEPADGLRVVPGKGATGSWQGRRFWVGSQRFLAESGLDTAEAQRHTDALAAEGMSVIAVGNDGHVCGLIALADTARPGAAAALAELRILGVERVVMLTGDHAAAAAAIARETGVTEVRSDLLPEEKVAAVEELVRESGLVAMVGDGVNDAPALARASLGIAMGAAGTDAAIETADIALMSDELDKLPWLVRHSRRTLGIIRQNIGISLGVKVLFFLLALAGYTSLWGAIAADMGTSLVVIFNGLRLLKV